MATDGKTTGVLDAERRRASFDATALEEIVNRGRAKAIAKYQPLFADAPFDNQDMDAYMDYTSLFEKKIERVAEAFRIIRSDDSFLFAHMKQKVKMADMFEHNGIFLHFTMMLNYLKSQGTKEQQRFWLEHARDGDFLAAYAQTELGHGSNVRGLETNATLDKATQEWVVHSPTLTSMKMWPTGMYACTHALVFANLIIDGTNHGFHGFMVQLRQADGTTMPGVELGEIGPKLNSASTNIGYCRFAHVRVPMNHLFSKHSKVTPEGKYIAAPRTLSKFRYISMMLARVSIVGVAYEELAKATTIAVRYSAVRLQGFKGDGKTEHNVLDYTMQQYRTFKALALSYCLLWNRMYILAFIKRVQADIAEGGNGEGMAELHGALSGMKATSTVRAHESIEECRKCCGGQGFLTSSGIGKISPDFSEWVTVEGEQVILSLQTARFLMKAVHEIDEKGAVSAAETVRYLAASASSPASQAGRGLATPAGIVGWLAARARTIARRLTAEVDAELAKGATFDEALNSRAVLAYRASEAHVVYVMMDNNFKAIDKYFSDKPAISKVMTRLMELYGLQEISENAGGWLGTVTEADVSVIDGRIRELLLAIRPDAVALVDSFGFLDMQLRSTIGRKDGKVYEAIYAEAKKNPLNGPGAMVGWDALSQVLDLEFLNETSRLQRVVRDDGSVQSATAAAKL